VFSHVPGYDMPWYAMEGEAWMATSRGGRVQGRRQPQYKTDESGRGQTNNKENEE
jgi:hypothetical protein